MTAALVHLRSAEQNVEQLARATASAVLWMSARYCGIDRTQLFRASQWPHPPARARAIAVYILATHFNYRVEDACAAIGLQPNRKYGWKLKQRVADARDDDAALDAFLDEVGSFIGGRA